MSGGRSVPDNKLAASIQQAKNIIADIKKLDPSADSYDEQEFIRLMTLLHDPVSEIFEASSAPGSDEALTWIVDEYALLFFEKAYSSNFKQDHSFKTLLSKCALVKRPVDTEEISEAKDLSNYQIQQCLPEEKATQFLLSAVVGRMIYSQLQSIFLSLQYVAPEEAKEQANDISYLSNFIEQHRQYYANFSLKKDRISTFPYQERAHILNICDRYALLQKIEYIDVTTRSFEENIFALDEGVVEPFLRAQKTKVHHDGPQGQPKPTTLEVPAAPPAAPAPSQQPQPSFWSRWWDSMSMKATREGMKIKWAILPPRVKLGLKGLGLLFATLVGVGAILSGFGIAFVAGVALIGVAVWLVSPMIYGLWNMIPTPPAAPSPEAQPQPPAPASGQSPSHQSTSTRDIYVAGVRIVQIDNPPAAPSSSDQPGRPPSPVVVEMRTLAPAQGQAADSSPPRSPKGPSQSSTT